MRGKEKTTIVPMDYGAASRPVKGPIAGSMDGGAAGISIGRNAFRHPTPDRFIEAAAASVPEGRGVEEALEIIKVLGTGGSKP